MLFEKNNDKIKSYVAGQLRLNWYADAPHIFQIDHSILPILHATVIHFLKNFKSNMNLCFKSNGVVANDIITK